MTNQFSITDKSIVFNLHCEMYPKEVLFHAAYVLLDDNYFFFDKQKEYFVVTLTPKKTYKTEKLQELGNAFLDELVESRAYIEQLKRTSGVREILLQRALQTQSGEEIDFETLKKELEEKQ